MRCPNQFSQRTPVRFNITPLIDVVFLLIIFFLVASHFVRNEHAEPVVLPSSQLGDPDHDAAPYRLTVTIQDNGNLFIGGTQHSPESVIRQLSHLREQSARAQVTPEVRIRSDRKAAYLQIRTLMEACASLNIRSIRFAVAKNPESGQ